MKKLLFIMPIFFCCKSSPDIEEYPIISPERLQLTEEYSLRHYGERSYLLNDPEMIVIHYTAIDTLSESLACFKPDKVAASRRYIKKFGNLNVGVHFVVDKNGDIYSLLPLNIMGRHAIGYNYTALGIENVAANKGGLTQAQVESNALLVKFLLKKQHSLKYLIGHHEYIKRHLPHFKLYKAKDRTYRPTIKIDPGDKFMSDLREILQEKYDIQIEK